MPRIRVRPETGALYLDFRFRGVRCREQTALIDTPENRGKLERLCTRIDKALAQGTFQYADFFPDSPRAARFSEPSQVTPIGQAIRQGVAEDQVPTPTLRDFSATWVSENEVRWRRSYKAAREADLENLVLAALGDREVAGITRADVLAFRADIAKRPGHGGGTLSPARINKVMQLLRAILAEAAERFGFTTPMRGIKRLKQRRTRVEPFALDEANLIISHVREDYRPYITIRMFSGLRTGEANGLQWRDIDMAARTISVERTVSRNGDGETKTDESQRIVPMSDPVYEAFVEQRKQSVEGCPWVFHSPRGCPIDAVNFTNRVWYPLLRYLGVQARRPYQMRHTAATLMLASGENPEWIANVLGHTTTEMLFRTYSRYVPNLTRNDGRAFSGLLQERVSVPAGASEQDAGGGVEIAKLSDDAKQELLDLLTKELTREGKA